MAGAGGDLGGAGGMVGGSGGDVGGAGGMPVEWPTGNCDPLVEAVCGQPFPSMFYVQPDESTETGWHVRLNAEILPPNAGADPQILLDFLDDDGFPNSTAFFAVIDGGFVDTSNLTLPDDPSTSMSADSPVQLFDLDTGERIPAWSEVDLRGETAADRPLIVRPLTAIPFGHRAAVVITDNLRFEDGSTPSPTAGFLELRDGTPSANPDIEFRRSYTEEIFTVAEAAGVSRDSIVLAWQAPIMSEAKAKGPLPGMVEVAVAEAETATFNYEILGCIADDAEMRPELGCVTDQSELMPAEGGDWINTRDDGYPLWDEDWRRIYGLVDMPWFLDDDGRVVLDEAGNPVMQGTRPAKFVIMIPESVKGAAPGTVPIVTFGHGLLATPQDYIGDDKAGSGQHELSNKMEAIFVGTYWLGLSTDDFTRAANVAGDFSRMPALADLITQGVTNTILMTPFVQRVLSQDDLLQTADGSGSLVSPTDATYTGISQGGIFGTTYMALSPYVKTGVLHVPTGAYAHALPHSPQFAQFQLIVDGAVPDTNDQAMLFALIQRLFDPADPINYMQNIAAEPLTDLGAKECLWQCALGDTDAPWYGCEMMMRTGGFPQLGPTFREIYGVETIESPAGPGVSVLQYYDPGLGFPQPRLDERHNTGAHGSIRRNDEVHEQTKAFLDPEAPGVAISPCGGEPCVVTPAPRPRP